MTAIAEVYGADFKDGVNYGYASYDDTYLPYTRKMLSWRLVGWTLKRIEWTLTTAAQLYESSSEIVSNTIQRARSWYGMPHTDDEVFAWITEIDSRLKNVELRLLALAPPIVDSD